MSCCYSLLSKRSLLLCSMLKSSRPLTLLISRCLMLLSPVLVELVAPSLLNQKQQRKMMNERKGKDDHCSDDACRPLSLSSLC